MNQKVNNNTCILYFFICFCLYNHCFSQTLNSLIYPFKTDTIFYSKEKEEQFYNKIKDCDSILNAVNTEKKYESLNREEMKLLTSCDQEIFEYYDVSSKQCNWYCAGGPDTLLASSKKKNSRRHYFGVSNIHDFMHNSIWLTKYQKKVPWITFLFSYYSPRVTTIAITNGDVSTEKRYKHYSRAKTIEISYNDTVIGFIQLLDLRSTQYFEIGVLGNKKDLLQNDKEVGTWELRLKVLDVYQGKKKNFLAMTDIFFDGLDLIH